MKLRLFLVGALSSFGLGAAGAAELGGVPAARLERLTRGVNLSHWFSQMHHGQHDAEWFDRYLGEADIKLIAAAGFRHVRYPVEFEMFLDEARPAVLRPEFLARFDAALDQMRAAGLAVIVDWHAREETKHRVATDPVFTQHAVELWGAMARHLASRDPEWVFFETFNEPAAKMTAEHWASIQDRMIDAIRAAAPHHTIIVSPCRWSGLDDLLSMPPHRQTNLVYNFHFYEPMVFTHQSAAWPEMGLEPVAGLRYPVEEVSKRESLAQVGDGKGRRHVLAYEANRAWLEARLAAAKEWQQRHGVPVTCNEFGVYAKVAPREDRLRWIRDTREVLEQIGIGWAMWDYAGGFFVATGDSATGRTMDAECLRALGLKP